MLFGKKKLVSNKDFNDSYKGIANKLPHVAKIAKRQRTCVKERRP